MFIPLSLEDELSLISNFIGIVAGVYPLCPLSLMDTTEFVTEETLSIIALGTFTCRSSGCDDSGRCTLKHYFGSCLWMHESQLHLYLLFLMLVRL